MNALPLRGPQDDLALLRRYHEHDDFGARAQVIERLMPLVHHVARRYRDRGESYDDLVQAGALGLVKAIDRFDLSRDVSIATFLVPNIAGEIRRHFRDRGWSIRVPRELQEHDALLQRTATRLVRELQRQPTMQELADGAGLTLDQALDATMAARNYTAVSLDAPIGDDDDAGASRLDQLGGPDDGFAQAEHRLAVLDGLQHLQERERLIVTRRFREQRTQSEIAAELGISQMHVSRLLRRALDTMRAGMQDAQDVPVSDAS